MSIRGLPDERPQQSVAKLVARWDSHVKRQSNIGTAGTASPGQHNNNGASPVMSPSQSRSTSVVSHNTGDSALIETKERREWPPKPKIVDGTGIGTGTSTSNGQFVLSTRSTSTSSFSVGDVRRSLEKTAENGTAATHDVVGAGAGATSPSQPASSVTHGDEHGQEALLSVSAESIIEKHDSKEPTSEPPLANTSNESTTEEVKSDPASGKKASPTTTTTTTTTTRATGKLASSKSTPSSRTSGTTTASSKGTSTQRHSTISQSKSLSSSTPSAKTATPPVAKPVTAHRTGNSTVGSAAASARAGMKSPPVSSRAKTPTALRPSTSGSQHKAPSQPPAARAKTPTAFSAARSKTPTASHPPKHTTSSGLYAPTKASLARARNVDAPPPPVPKATVSSSSLERLMRPTAASASKAREGPVSPPRAPSVTKIATRGAAPSPARGNTVKPRVGHAPARMKAGREKKDKEGATKEAVAAAAQPTVPSEHVTSEDESFPIEQPSFVSTTAHSDTSRDHEHDVSRESDHDQEDDHAGPPSDIESYDDAFASDDERALELDQAHLLSARPREEGEKEPFASTPDLPADIPDMTPQTATFADIVPVTPKDGEEAVREDGSGVSDSHPAHAEEVEEFKVAEKEKAADAPVLLPVSGASAVEQTHTADASVAATEEIVLDAGVNDTAAASEAESESKLNGLATSPIPEPETTEFDSVLDMLAVKPPARIASLGVIPDED